MDRRSQLALSLANGALGLALAISGCGTRAAPAPTPAEPTPTPGGPCETIEHRGTCAFVEATEGPAPMPTEVLVTARYRLVRAEPPSADGGPTRLVRELRVAPSQVAALRAHLAQHAEVPCTYWGVTGSCAAPEPVIDVPPFAAPSTP